MIITVSLNPCIDKTILLNTFNYGGLNRAEHTRTDVSGKGINVAKAVKQLGMEVSCLGFNYIENKALLEEELLKHSIAFNFIDLPGCIRTNIKVYEKETGIMTEINERGEYADEQAVQNLLHSFDEKNGDIYILSGSVPRGVDSDIYQRIIRRLDGKPVILDAELEYLRLGITAKPTVIKPNLFELESLVGEKLDSHTDIVMQCKKIINQGVKIVCVSMGKDGAIIADEKNAFFAPSMPITVRGVQGAGDSMVAGICRAMQQGLSLDDMLRYAVATASGSLIHEGTLMCTAEDFAVMLPKVEIKEI